MDPNNIPPELAVYMRKLANDNERTKLQMEALKKRYLSLRQEHEDDRLKLRELNIAVKKAAERIHYIEDIPGKRVPYWLGFIIEVPGPTNPTVTVRNQRLTDTKQVSQDGPFVCTTFMSAFLLKTFSIGPYVFDEETQTGRPNDPIAGTEVITPLSGRFRPVASTADPFAGAYIGARVGVGATGATSVAQAAAVQTFRPGICDFLWEVMDSGVDRKRNNEIPVPSRYLYSEFDRPTYLPASDFYERSSSITFAATFTRELGFAEVNYGALPNGFAEGNANPPPDPGLPPPPPAPGNTAGRQVVGLGGTLYFTMVGYKILQAQSPAV